MSRIARFTAAAAFCVALIVPAVSAAHPGQRGFGQTFPIASRLCAAVTNGHAPQRLQASVPAVLTACTTLNTSFADAQNAYATTVAPLKTAGVAALQTARQACVAARQSHTAGACRTAIQAARATIAGLRQQVRSAAGTYHASVQAARLAFWTTIHGLRGGASIPGDTTVGPAPVTPLPTVAPVPAS
jgi:hypothetical protein